MAEPHRRRRAGRVLLTAVSVIGVMSLYSSLSTAGKQQGFTYRWPRPRLAVDPVIVAPPAGKHRHARVLLVKRGGRPFKGYWGVPGGFVEAGERLAAAAAREVREETGLDIANARLEQVAVFDDPWRDATPGWCVGVTYAALLPATASLEVRAGDDAREVRWHDVLSVPKLAFDHKQVLRAAFRHLAERPAAKAVRGLPEQLRKAAEQLEGPWPRTDDATDS